MALESGSYISDLVAANPDGTDTRSQGDDHIRLIKQVLKNTLPNLNGAMTATDEQLNKVAADGTLCFPGMITMWSGTVATIPAGWKLCNGSGTISNGSPVPNLVSRFIIGSGTTSGGTYDIGDTGGSSNIAVSGTTQGTALTINQIPSHDHQMYSLTTTAFPGAELALAKANSTFGATLSGGTGDTGGGQAHTHGVNFTLSGANIPPYFALAFIIKD